MTAPVCPINRSQPTSAVAVPQRQKPTKLPIIPPATDLPSLIRTVNVMRDVLRSITTSLTVNNFYPPRPIPQPSAQATGPDPITSPYPEWVQNDMDIVYGFVVKKDKEGKHKDEYAYIARTNAVEFLNVYSDGNETQEFFTWRYIIPLDSPGSTDKVIPFREDFFERVINVHWSTALAVEFFDRGT